MKKVFSTVMAFAMIMAFVSFTACSKDDKDESNGFIGTWKCVLSDHLIEADEVKTTNYLQFKENGTYISVTVYEFNLKELGPNTRNEWTVQSGTWKVSGNIIYSLIDGVSDEVTYNVSGNQLTLKSKTGFTTPLTYSRVADSEIDKYLKRR